jgi:beta-glucosidase
MKIIKAPTTKEASALELKNRALARKAAAEGFVLLENDGTLPLKEKRIALYGAGARMTVKGGTGSGAVRERYSVTIEQGLINAGYEIASTPWLDRFDRFYADTYETYRQEQEDRVKGMQNFYQILGTVRPFQHPTGIPITEEDVEASGCDTALYVLARQAGEGNDRVDEQGDYRLDDVEWENLEFVSAHYKNLVVIVNCGGVIDLSFLDKLHVSALVYFVQGGEEGGNALADVLSGKKNFSGRLATSWAYRFEDIPSNTTYSYLGGDKYNQKNNEGIYVGYRFFDSFGVKPR